jgi:hypothetical protein
VSANLTLKVKEDLDGRMIGTQAKTGVAASGSCSGTLCTNLVASWKLDDLVDATGNVTDLTNNNSVTFVAGKIGNAGQFVAASSKNLHHASTSILQMGDIDFTIGAWVFLDSKPGDMMIVAKHDDTTGLDYRLQYTGAFDAFTFVAAVGAAAQTVNNAGTLTPATSTWYCVLGWHDATANTINISVNDAHGNSVGTGGALDSPLACPFRIGARAYTSFENYFDGKIDNVNLWKKMLNSTERTAWYNSGSGLEYPYTVP